jgi:hypothetical protein
VDKFRELSIRNCGLIALRVGRDCGGRMDKRACRLSRNTPNRLAVVQRQHRGRTVRRRGPPLSRLRFSASA